MKWLVIPVLLALSACAASPEDIAAVDVGPRAYNGFNCAQLADAKIKYQQSLENLSAQQRSAQSGDAVGVFLLGLPLSSMSGGDQETQIALAKGHIQAVELEQARRKCQ
ncbi:hypothetical protein [Salipiger marinus]|uniref:hypothetical protein n=1 Tax=Salipiger marinus TaxID=555512 RepID=UPI004059E0CB